MKKILNFFDKLEDNIRFTLSRTPNIYAFISGVGIVLFFRGVWMIADASPYLYDRPYSGWLTLGISLIILLITGTLVSHHLRTDILVSGLKKEKKLDEKTMEEIRSEEKLFKEVKIELSEIKKEIEEIKKRL